MKVSEFKKLIREEVRRALRENIQNKFVIGDTINPDMWNSSHPMVKKYKSILTSPHKIVHFMDKNDNIIKQMPAEGFIVLSGGPGMGSKFLKTLPIEALK